MRLGIFDVIQKSPYNADSTKRKGGTNFFTFKGLLSRKEDSFLSD